METHIPVLLKETIELLDPKPGENFVDCTFGFGGHARAILEKNAPDGRVLGIEWDEGAIKKYRKEHPSVEERLTVELGNFATIDKIIGRLGFGPVNGILFDLGMSSWDVEASGRGFSFLRDEPLDMRFNSANRHTAEEVVNSFGREALADIISKYGDEKFATAIAGRIALARAAAPIKTTKQLVEVIRRAVPAAYAKGKMHWATKTFQALRIEVNSEFENISAALPKALNALSPGGRLAVITFHSLEDKIVKNFLKEVSTNKKAILLTKKPIEPSAEECRVNPRARSAKLRVASKLTA
jgi:16S rRNA (cytosine1402-N4)-methyltransferase